MKASKTMAKKTSTIGLDIGSNSIKLVQVRPSKQGVSLENFALSILEPDAIYEGGIRDTDTIINTIKELVKSQQLKTKNIALSIGGHSVIIKKISLPAMSDEELAESIHWEAEQYIPFDLVDVYLDYQILQTRFDQGQMDVLLVAAKKDVVDQYVEVVRAADLKPVVVDTDCFAVQNTFDINYGIPQDKLICIIHIGAENLSINVIAYGLTTFTRDLQMGGELYTREIQKQMGVSYEEAEAYKFGGGSDAHSHIIPQDVQRILVSMSENLAAEINRSLEFHLATSGEDHFDHIYLSGGGAKLSYLAKEISKKTGSPVNIIDPFRNIKIDDKLFKLSYIDEMKPLASVALGLSIRHRGDKTEDMVKINLLPISDADRIEDGRNFFVVLFLILVFVSVSFYYVKQQTINELSIQQQTLSGLKRKQKELDEKIKNSKALEKSFKEIKKDVDREQEVINDLTQNQVSPAGLLNDLSYLLSPPKDDTERENFTQKGWRWNWDTGSVWIEELKEDKREVKIRGFARTINDVGELLNRLNVSQYFVKTTLKMTEAEKKSFPNGKKGIFVRFEIEARVVYGTSDLKKLYQEAGEPLPGTRTSSIPQSIPQN
jgi:type IV pilus assembly protein PilM